ncbi:MAG: SusC/RagA family TonB-linked outer membrane protein [Dysgonamonadaceae bacterium]|jgi:TonB-linked SusC/RagA family outer membrane protein|nr:SusC/RagA family TonB-linked outer membrane protein [Dysgonamonadaceae bacterium]
MRNILLLIFMSISSPGWAQTAALVAKGTVKNVQGETLIGVNVRLKDSKVGVVTDMDGQFELTIPASVKNPVLLFSYVGYKEKEVPYKGVELAILLEDNTVLSEVVVTGLFNRAKESYTGAASMVTRKDLDLAGASGVLSSLHNIDPSFNMLENNLFGSDPNNIEAMNITMRGSTSLADVQNAGQTTASKSNLPLFIVDKFEVELKDVIDLDNNRVESITILKDAASTALYGSKGANGVVVITTRKPQTGKLTVSYRGKTSFQAPDLSSYNLMNASEKLDYELAAGLYSYLSPTIEENLMAVYNHRRIDAERGVNTYWLSFPVRLGVGQEHNLSVEGGENAMRYAINLGYSNNVGVMKGSDRNTFNGNVFLSYEKGSLLFSNDLGITSNKAHHSHYGSFSRYAKMNAYYSPFDEDGNLIKQLDNVNYYSLPNIYMNNNRNSLNPLWDASLPQRNDASYIRIRNNFGLDWYILPETFFLRGRFSITREESRSDYYLSAEHSSFANISESNFNRKGSYSLSIGSRTDFNGDVTLNFNKTLAKVHQLAGGGGLNIYQELTEKNIFNAEGFPVSDMNYITAATQYEENGHPDGSEELRRGLKAYGFVNYTYSRRYFSDLSYALEGNSQFGAEKRFAPFWSVGLGWNAHQERFLKDDAVLDVFRMRVSYGSTGSVKFSPYQAMTMYSVINHLNYRGLSGLSLMGLGNAGLGWQKTNTLNLGMDVELLDRRITAKVDAYNKITNDLITMLFVPASSGFAGYTANIGQIANRGIEAELKWQVIRDNDHRLFWTVGASVVHNKNEVLKISDTLDALNEQLTSEEGKTSDEIALQRRNPAFLIKEGESINTIFAVKSKGIDPSTGKEIFVQLDGTETFEWSASDLAACGTTDPLIWGNLNTSLRFRDFTFTTFFSYRLGAYTYNNALIEKVENIIPYENADRRALYDRWKKPGDVSYFKSVKDFTSTNATTRFVMKNNYVECSSINLRYDVPREWIKKNLKISAVSLQGTAENLFYTSTIKRERGTSYPFSNKFYFTMTVNF